MNRKRKYDVHIRMDEKKYADLMKRKDMSDLPITTIILLALEGQSIREKQPQEFYNIFSRLFEITNTIDAIIRKTEGTKKDYLYELRLYRNELSRLAREISNRYM